MCEKCFFWRATQIGCDDVDESVRPPAFLGLRKPRNRPGALVAHMLISWHPVAFRPAAFEHGIASAIARVQCIGRLTCAGFVLPFATAHRTANNLLASLGVQFLTRVGVLDRCGDHGRRTRVLSWPAASVVPVVSPLSLLHNPPLHHTSTHGRTHI